MSIKGSTLPVLAMSGAVSAKSTYEGVEFFKFVNSTSTSWIWVVVTRKANYYAPYTSCLHDQPFQIYFWLIWFTVVWAAYYPLHAKLGTIRYFSISSIEFIDRHCRSSVVDRKIDVTLSAHRVEFIRDTVALSFWRKLVALSVYRCRAFTNEGAISVSLSYSRCKILMYILRCKCRKMWKTLL